MHGVASGAGPSRHRRCPRWAEGGERTSKRRREGERNKSGQARQMQRALALESSMADTRRACRCQSVGHGQSQRVRRHAHKRGSCERVSQASRRRVAGKLLCCTAALVCVRWHFWLVRSSEVRSVPANWAFACELVSERQYTFSPVATVVNNPSPALGEAEGSDDSNCNRVGLSRTRSNQ